MSALDRRSSSVNCSPGHEPADACHGNVALVVLECGQQSRQGHHRVRRRATEDTRVQRVLQRSDGHDARDVAAERGREGRLTDAEVADVAYDEEVAVEQLGVSLDEGLQVALRLLHALEDQLDGAGRLPVEDAHGPEVGHEAADVVGGLASVDATVLLAGRGPGPSSSPAPAEPAGRRSARTTPPRASLPVRELGIDGRVSARDVQESGVAEAGFWNRSNVTCPIRWTGSAG